MLRNAYHALVVRFACTGLGSWMVLNVFNRVDRWLIRWSKGAINSSSGTHFNTALLRSRGARSGKLRETPLLATPLGEQFVLIASATGQRKNPAWYYNLKANPECSLLIHPHGEVDCVAHEAAGEERNRAWAAANALYSGYESYQEKTERRIAVMVLSRSGNDG